MRTLLPLLFILISCPSLAGEKPEEVYADDDDVCQIMLTATWSALRELHALFSSLGDISAATNAEVLKKYIGAGERVSRYFTRMRDYRLSPVCCLAFLMDEGRICGGCLYKQREFFTLAEVRQVRSQIKSMRNRLRELEGDRADAP